MTALLRLSAGLIAWAVAFALVYGLHGIGCASGWDARSVGPIGVQRLVLLGAWGLSVAASLAVVRRLSRRRATILDRAAIATGWSGVAAVLISFVPVAIVPACL